LISADEEEEEEMGEEEEEEQIDLHFVVVTLIQEIAQANR